MDGCMHTLYCVYPTKKEAWLEKENEFSLFPPSAPHKSLLLALLFFFLSLPCLLMYIRRYTGDEINTDVSRMVIIFKARF